MSRTALPSRPIAGFSDSPSFMDSGLVLEVGLQHRSTPGGSPEDVRQEPPYPPLDP